MLHLLHYNKILKDYSSGLSYHCSYYWYTINHYIHESTLLHILKIIIKYKMYMLLEVYLLKKCMEVYFSKKIMHLWMNLIYCQNEIKFRIYFISILPFILRYVLKKFIGINLKDQEGRSFIRAFIRAMLHNSLIDVAVEKVNESHLAAPTFRNLKTMF